MTDGRRQLEALDWKAIDRELTTRGYARLPSLLEARTCEAVADSFDEDASFRSTIEMAAHAYGDGSYRYFAYPLPPVVEALRAHLYPPLAAIANRWNEQLRIERRYPETLAAFLAACHAVGQDRPTPLILRYGPDGYNRMHQDVYGDLAFPLQVACVLSSPRDYEGGEFLISENRPRMQVRTEAIRLGQGEGIIFANALRPVQSVRGFARATMRHGVSRILTGRRVALGIIFHDAR